jgi:hypothetical protein
MPNTKRHSKVRKVLKEHKNELISKYSVLNEIITFYLKLIINNNTAEYHKIT